MGNRLSNGLPDSNDANRHYVYNDRGRLKTVYTKAPTQDCDLIDYLYSGYGSLEMKVVYNSTSCNNAIAYAELYVMDPSGQTFYQQTYSGSGTITNKEELIHVRDMLVAKVSETTGDTEFYVHNHQNSIIAVVDDTNQLIETISYSPYGGPIGEIISQYAHLSNQLEGVTKTGIQGRRHQDYLTRQFLTGDTAIPFALDQVRASIGGELTNGPGLKELTFVTNPYQYGNVSPVTWSDPSGDNAIIGGLAVLGLGAYAYGYLDAADSIMQNGYNTDTQNQLFVAIAGGGIPKVAAGTTKAVKGFAQGYAVRQSIKQDANSIAQHAFEPHVQGGKELVTQAAYRKLGISTQKQFANHISDIISNPSSRRATQGDTTSYFDGQTVVHRNSSVEHVGTAFVPGPTNAKPSQTPESYWSDYTNQRNVNVE